MSKRMNIGNLGLRYQFAHFLYKNKVPYILEIQTVQQTGTNRYLSILCYVIYFVFQESPVDSFPG